MAVSNNLGSGKYSQAEPEQEQSVEVVVAPLNAIEMMERASIDIQIATAHQYPRFTKQNGGYRAFLSDCIDMACSDDQTAESCIYRRPVGKDYNTGEQTYAEGESIRFAEIVASRYGNLRIKASVIENTDRYVKVMGMGHDLESNYAVQVEVVESTVKKNGQPFDERMRLVVLKAALAKAKRDATFQVVPKAICKPIIAAVRNVIAGNQRPLTERRAAVAQWLSKLSIDNNRVFTALGVSGLEEIGNEQLEILTGLRTAIKEGDVTLDEAFPVVTTPPPSPKKEAKQAKVKPAPEPTTEPEPTPEIEQPQDSGLFEEPQTEPEPTPAEAKLDSILERMAIATNRAELAGLEMEGKQAGLDSAAMTKIRKAYQNRVIELK